MGFKTGASIGFAVAMALASACKCNRAAERRAPPPRAVVSIAWPGASVDEVEAMLAQPMEAALMALPGLARLEARCAEGQVEILAEGKGGPDSLTSWTQAVRTGLERVVGQLPEDAEAPMVASGVPPVAALVTLGADMPRDRLQGLGEKLRHELERLPGVAQVRVFGARRQEVVVAVDADRLRAYGLSTLDLAQALRAGAVGLPGGSVATGGGEFLIRTDAGGPTNIEELANTVVKATPDGNVIRLADLASVSHGFADAQATEVVTSAGPGLLLAVHLWPGRVGPETFKAIAGVLARTTEQAPPGVFAMLQPLGGLEPTQLVVGRLDLPAGLGLERTSELLAPLWRDGGLLGSSAPFVLVIGPAPGLAVPALGGHGAVLVAAPQKPASPQALSAQLRAWADRIPDLEADFRSLADLQRPGARIAVLVCADAPEPATESIAERLRKRPGLRVWSRPGGARPELVVEVDRERAARLGISAATVDRVVRLATAGEEILSIRAGGQDIGVRLELQPAVDLKSDPSSLLRLKVPSPGGLAVGLGQVARIKQGLARPERLRVDGRRCARVVIEPDKPWGGAEVKALVDQVRTWVPPGATVTVRRL